MTKQTIIKRIERLETKSTDPRIKVVIIDKCVKCGPIYSRSCGNGVTEKEYKAWLKTLDFHDQLYVIEIVPNTVPSLKVNVDGYCGHALVELQNNEAENLGDLLTRYNARIEKAES